MKVAHVCETHVAVCCQFPGRFIPVGVEKSTFGDHRSTSCWGLETESETKVLVNRFGGFLFILYSCVCAWLVWTKLLFELYIVLSL